MWRRVRSFFRTPKGQLTIILAVFIAIAAPGQGLHTVVPGLAAAALAAGVLDLLILRLRKRAWEFPSGAVLTAMIVALVLRAQEPWWVITISSAGAVLSKYVVRSRTANIFNPAALAIIVSFYAFHSGQSWWGALTEVPLGVQTVLLAAGVYITDRVNKLPLVLSFLGVYFFLFTLTAFVADPQWVAEIFRPPDVEAALFFAFIILTDPPTSPAKYPDQVVCGTIVAAVSYLFFEWAGVVYYLLAGVLAGNLWEAWRRTSRRTGTTFPRGIGAFVADLAPWNSVEMPSPAAELTTSRASARLAFQDSTLASSASSFPPYL